MSKTASQKLLRDLNQRIGQLEHENMLMSDLLAMCHIDKGTYTDGPVMTADVRKLFARIAELDEYLHEIYHITRRGNDPDGYDDWQAMNDIGGVIDRFMKSRKALEGSSE